MKKLVKNIRLFILETKLMFQEFFHKKTFKKQLANMLSFLRLLLIIPIFILIVFYLNNHDIQFLIITGILLIPELKCVFIDSVQLRTFSKEVGFVTSNITIMPSALLKELAVNE